ncbi:hypothetical protein HRG_000585 [Hirsutella rhossiliensis]|uniref:Uncharacterized protein n=1 Tax=Hirsutella rhossiliensis TaxID=111463 RepID=A0A9P8N3Y9_9HYPO|nr:uncharacterized protein HRG_00585 [Hirsutella rhossiliensis]KAH0967943.1 hypothetical protein HRG_00585 [Hirsutella rhossiliensis]
MNTVRSFWLGWGSLCVAGAGAYYFAKREINADRQAKLEQARKKSDNIRSLEYAAADPGASSGTSNGGPARTDSAATESQRVTEKSKYESNAPYRSPKGDRFS